MDMRIPPLRIKIVLESNTLKSIMLVGEPGVRLQPGFMACILLTYNWVAPLV